MYKCEEKKKYFITFFPFTLKIGIRFSEGFLLLWLNSRLFASKNAPLS
jgi:hypothetical protein